MTGDRRPLAPRPDAAEGPVDPAEAPAGRPLRKVGPEDEDRRVKPGEAGANDD